MASRGKGRRGRPRGASQAPHQKAFAKAVGIAADVIAQACAIVSQGRSNDLQRLEAHHPPMAIEGGVDDIRGIQDMGAGTKRKEDPSSSNPGKKQKTYVPHGVWGQGRGHQGQGKVNYLEMGNTSGLLPSRGRGRASIVTNLSITDGIIYKGRGLLSHECPRYRDVTGLLIRQGRWYVSTASSLDI